MIAVADYKKLSVEEIGELLSRFIDGDTDAGWDIVLSCRPWIMRLARQASDHCGGDAEDLAQELSILVYQSLRDYDPQKGSLGNFIHVIAKRRLGRVAAQLQGTEVGGNAGQLDSSADGLGVQSHEPVAPIDERQTMFAELNEVCHDVPPIGIAALRYKYLDELSKGACIKRLLSDFPEAFGGVRTGSRQAYVDDIANESIKQLQESLGIVSPQADGEVGARWRPKAEYQRDPQAGLPLPIELRAAIIEYARKHPNQTSAAIQREFSRLGKKVSTTTVRSVLSANGLARRKTRGANPEQAKKTSSNLRASRLTRAKSRQSVIPKSPRTAHRFGSKTPADLREAIVGLAEANPSYSSRDIFNELRTRGYILHVRTVRRIIAAHGLARSKGSHGTETSPELHEAIIRIAKEHPLKSATEIHKELCERGERIGCTATVRNILAASGLSRAKIRGRLRHKTQSQG